MKLFFVVAIAAAIAGCAPQRAEDVSDAEIAEFKDGFVRGCNKSIVERGATTDQADALCGCIMDKLEARLTHQQWQAGLVESKEKFLVHVQAVQGQCAATPG